MFECQNFIWGIEAVFILILILLNKMFIDMINDGNWSRESSFPPSDSMTDPWPLQNMPNVRDHDASVYLRLQGDALSVGGYEPNPIFWDEVRRRWW